MSPGSVVGQKFLSGNIKKRKCLERTLGIQDFLQEISQKIKFIDHLRVGGNGRNQQGIGTTINIGPDTKTFSGINRNRRKGFDKPVNIRVEEVPPENMVFPVDPLDLYRLNISVAPANETNDHLFVLLRNSDNPVVFTPDDKRVGGVNLHCIR